MFKSFTMDKHARVISKMSEDLSQLDDAKTVYWSNNIILQFVN